MKKIIFNQLLKDITKFFLLSSLSLSLIIWVIQAVNFLDYISEDGHGLVTYFNITLLNFPKIFSRIMPFCIFLLYNVKFLQDKLGLLIKLFISKNLQSLKSNVPKTDILFIANHENFPIHSNRKKTFIKSTSNSLSHRLNSYPYTRKVLWFSHPYLHISQTRNGCSKTVLPIKIFLAKTNRIVHNLNSKIAKSEWKMLHTLHIYRTKF